MLGAVSSGQGNTSDSDKDSQKHKVSQESRKSQPEFSIDPKRDIPPKDTQKRPPATGVQDTIAPSPPPDWANDPITRQKYYDSLQGYFEYRRRGYLHRQSDFTWQHYSTVVIFISVLALVFSGMYFAYVQFHADLRLRAQPRTSESGEKSEVELSIKGIRVSSPVLGVIILAVSLAFFYLYLVYVYPINDVF